MLLLSCFTAEKESISGKTIGIIISFRRKVSISGHLQLHGTALCLLTHFSSFLALWSALCHNLAVFRELSLDRQGSEAKRK